MSIARKAVRGAVWTVLSSMLGRFLSVTGTLVLTYFLAPEEVGEVAKASILVLTAGQLSLFGFGQYLVSRRDIDRPTVWHLSVLTIGFAVLALGGLIAIGIPIALSRGADTLARYLPWLALSGFLSRIGIVPERLLIREMRFGYVGMSRTAGEIVQATVSVGLAWAGLGGISMVLGNLAGSAVKATLYVSAVDRREWLTPHPLDRARLRSIFHFGGPLWLGATAQFGSRNWDNLLVAWLFGDGAMGMYKQAYNLADIPTAQVGEAIGDVLVPSFARVDDETKARTLVRSTGLLALIVFPLAIGLGTVSPTLVAAVFNAQWQGLAPFLTVLSALSVTRPVGWIVSSYLQARGLTRVLMFLELFRVVAVMGSIAALSWFGPVVASAGVGLAFGVHAVASMWAVQALDGVRFGGMVRGMLGPLAACALMVGAVLGTRLLTSDLHTGLGLALEVGAGAVAYVVACIAVANKTTHDAIALLRRSFGRA